MAKLHVLHELWMFLKQEKKYWLAPIAVHLHAVLNHPRSHHAGFSAASLSVFGRVPARGRPHRLGSAGGAGSWFELGDSPYMLLVADVAASRRFPAPPGA